MNRRELFGGAMATVPLGAVFGDGFIQIPEGTEVRVSHPISKTVEEGIQDSFGVLYRIAMGWEQGQVSDQRIAAATAFIEQGRETLDRLLLQELYDLGVFKVGA